MVWLSDIRCLDHLAIIEFFFIIYKLKINTTNHVISPMIHVGHLQSKRN